MGSNVSVVSCLIRSCEDDLDADGVTAGVVMPMRSCFDPKDPDLEGGRPGAVTVLRRYTMSLRRDDVLGEGSSSICRRASEDETQMPVAIKVYKMRAGKEVIRQDELLTRFRRQVAVLKELQKPLEAPSGSELWSEHLAHANPSNLFLHLYDYSRDGAGLPGPDPQDSTMYVVTDMAQCDLKGYLASLRDQRKSLSRDGVQQIAQAIVLAVAALHAKGLVHLDLKPGNIMMFDGRTKLIDVDGCLRAGSDVEIGDTSISYSPCYCAPEWARFLVDTRASRLKVTPALDAWSIGLTLCELVTQRPLLRQWYSSFRRTSPSDSRYMQWLADLKRAPMSKDLEAFDPELTDLLASWLLVPRPAARRSLARTLAHPYFASLDAKLPRLLGPGFGERHALASPGVAELPQRIVKAEI